MLRLQMQELISIFNYEFKKMKTAIIIGTTGLTGSALLKQLLKDDDFNRLISFSRKQIGLTDPKLVQHSIDFNQISNYKELIKGDVVFCCMGTTIKTAGSKEAFKKVDFIFPTEFGKIAKQNGVKEFYLQSSLGADINSNNFYLKTKGEVEQILQQLNFNSFATFRPSMLLGKRSEFRFGELIGKVVMQLLSFLFIGKLKRYKAIHVNQVANAMIKQAKLNKPGNFIIENEEMIY
jgi:uncharacterized protein YbjT (DUF2867 family)